MYESFLLCRHCGVLHPVSIDSSADEDAAQDLAAFREEHEAHVLEDAQRLGELPDGDSGRLATTVLAFTHGLVVQALFDPDRLPAAAQTRLVDDFLAAFAR